MLARDVVRTRSLFGFDIDRRVDAVWCA